MSTTPHHLDSPRLDKLGLQSNKSLGKDLFFGQTILKAGDARVEIYMAIAELKTN